MHYILFDKAKSEIYSFLIKGLGNNCVACYSPETSIAILGWLYGVCTVLRKSKHDDTIICWYDFQAILCFWVSKLLFFKRKIICINLLLKDKPTCKNRIVSFLYKKALLSHNFTASVTSLKYGEWLNKRLGINIKYPMVHDVYHESYKYSHAIQEDSKSVFCGGRNGRDWYFMLKIAQALPDITFNIVMPFTIYSKLKSEVRDNMNIKCNISYDNFMKELCHSSLVCLPLDTQAPAGLIVMFQAAANLKPIITTRTATTLEYITPQRGITLPNEISAWCNTIKSCLENIEESKNRAAKLKNYLIENCSEEIFISKIKKMLC